MRILTNPGSNLRREVVAAYEIALAPQTLVVDDARHDTRAPLPLAQIERWIASSKAHPFVVGSTAAETVESCRELSKLDPRILIITTSRKIIQTHAASTTAARLLASQAATRDIALSVVDSGVTDVGAGLAVILAGECRRAGLDLAATTTVVERFAATLQCAVVPAMLDYLVAGGRAGILRARIADWLDRRPMLGFVEGELVNHGLVSSKKPPDAELVERMVSRLGNRRAVWAAIAHGGSPETVAGLSALLREKLDVRFLYVMPLSAGVFIHLGPGARLVAAGAVDELGVSFDRPSIGSD